MSLASIATNLYTIQSRKNVPLKTAFSMMVREDMAMRFSVYNLVKLITKSEFLATVAQTAYGKRTPLQKAQDEEDRKKEMNDKKFKVYTQVTFARINNRLNLLTSISERNSQLIMNLYSELGYFRGQRKVSLNSNVIFSTRVMLPSKTVKNKIEEIEKQLNQIKNIKQPRARSRGAVAKKKGAAPSKQSEDGFMKFLPLLLSNPRLLGLMAGGGVGALSLGSYLTQAYSLFNLPSTAGRISNRLKGDTSYEDPTTEEISQLIDPALAGVGAFTATGGIIGGGLATVGAFKKGKELLIRRNLDKKIAGRTAQVSLDARNSRALFRAYQQGKNLNAPGLQQTAEQRDKAVRARAERRFNTRQLTKWQKLSPILRKLGPLAAAGTAADVSMTIGQMSNHVANHANGKLNDQQFKENMITGYAELISTVGTTGLTTALGAGLGLAGTAIFPGIGTLGGTILGMGGGLLLAYLIDENDGKEGTLRSIATKAYEMIHEDKVLTLSNKDTRSVSLNDDSRSRVGSTTRAQSGVTTQSSESSKVRSIRNNNPGNLRFANQREAVGVDSSGFAIFATPEAGLRAMLAQIKLDTQTRGETLYKFISEYAPSSENDTLGYVDFVSKQTGIQPYEKVPESKIPLVMRAMIKMEGGDAALRYFDNNFRTDNNRILVATADVIRTSPPPLTVANSNIPVSSMPSVEEGPKAEPDLQARIDSTVAINYGKIVKNQMTAGIGAVNQKITDLSKKTTTEFPFSTNPEASISSYKT